MDKKASFIFEVERFKAVAENAINALPEKWLNVAYKFDYISLTRKETIDSLLKIYDEMMRFNVDHKITLKNIKDMQVIISIAENSRFAAGMLAYD